MTIRRHRTPKHWGERITAGDLQAAGGFAAYLKEFAEQRREADLRAAMHRFWDAPKVSITPLEAEILAHRLDVPDAIAEAIEADPIEVYDACELLQLMARARLLPARLSGDLAEVLADCVDGSTYAAASTEDTPQRYAAICRAGDRLADKVSQIIGRPVAFPYR